MIRIGTLCYVDPTCLTDRHAQGAVGRIVEVVSAPYEAPDWSYLPGTYYDVAFEGWTFYCHASKLRPISDPGAELGNETPLDEPVPHEDQRALPSSAVHGLFLQRQPPHEGP